VGKAIVVRLEEMRSPKGSKNPRREFYLFGFSGRAFSLVGADGNFVRRLANNPDSNSEMD
jgi:hypothetical protein